MKSYKCVCCCFQNVFNKLKKYENSLRALSCQFKARVSTSGKYKIVIQLDHF